MKAATVILATGTAYEKISIHAAREGGDSTSVSPRQQRLTISIHAAREGGDLIESGFANNVDISIHAAREGGDGPDAVVVTGETKFQSTPPVKAAT